MPVKSLPMLLLALVGAAATIIFFQAFDWAAWVCTLPSGEQSKALAPHVGACFEFWLNRYQSLIGTFLAAGVGLIALEALKYNRQQASAAIKQANIVNFEYNIKRLHILENIVAEWLSALDLIGAYSTALAHNWTNKEHEDYQYALRAKRDSIDNLTKSVYLPNFSSKLSALSMLDGFSMSVRDFHFTAKSYEKAGMEPASIAAIKTVRSLIATNTNFIDLINSEISGARTMLSEISSPHNMIR